MASCNHMWIKVAPLAEPRRQSDGKVVMVKVGDLLRCDKCGTAKERR